MKFTCPHCNQSLETETLYKGSGTVCPSCGGDLTIPESDVSSTPEPKESPKENFRMDFTAAKKVIQDNLKSDSLSLHQALTEKSIQQEDVDLDKTASGSLTSSPGDRYVIGEAITQGGMGAILDAKDVNARRNIAMKVILRPEQASNEDILRFVREGQVLAQLEHPGIVPLYEVGVDAAGNPFFTMKKVVGADLGEILRKLSEGHKKTIKDYPLSHLLNIFQRVCDAIAFAHSKRVIHRDLKPENIMIGEYGEVLVIDWGIAKILSRGGKSSATQDLTDTGRSERVKAFIDSVQSDDSGVAIKTLDGELMGTPRFMAPEQATGELSKIDDCTDIYALGAILYNILTLHPPITGDNLDELLKNVSTGKIKHPSSYNTTKKGKATGKKPQAVLLPHCPGRKIPDALGAVAMKALSLNPKDRYQYVKFLQRDLEAYQTGFATSVEEAGAWKQATLLIKRHKGIFMALAACLALMVLGSAAFVAKVMASERNAQQEKNRAEQALADFRSEQDKRTEAQAESASLYLPRVKKAIRERDFDNAVKEINRAVECEPNNLAARKLRACLRVHGKDFKGAVEDLEVYCRLEPKNKAMGVFLRRSKGVLKEKRPGDMTWFADLFKRAKYPQLGESLVEDEKKLFELYQKSIEVAWPGMGKNLKTLAKDDPRLSLSLAGSSVADLSPLRGMPLTKLSLTSIPVADLSPLKGMPLTKLSLTSIPVADLSPLEGMPLTSLGLSSVPVIDLSPLEGIPLNSLYLSSTKVGDLSPLRGMPLTSLFISEHMAGHHLADLSPLKGLKLESLEIHTCLKIRDISPLKGMPLRMLTIVNIRGITDVSPLKGMPLTNLTLMNTSVTDLTPLRGMRTLVSCSGMTRNVILSKIDEALNEGTFDAGIRSAKQVINDWKDVPAFDAYCKEAQTMIDATIPTLKALKNDPRADVSRLSEFKGHHYLRWYTPMKWQDAKKFCEKYGGHLVTITSEEEQLWVRRKYSESRVWVWIGGTDEQKTGQWRWVTGEEMDYLRNWQLGYPRADCHFLAMYGGGAWGTGTADSAYTFVIEWDR